MKSVNGFGSILVAACGIATAPAAARQSVEFLINSFDATVTNFAAPGSPFMATDALGVLGPPGAQLLITDLSIHLWAGSGNPGANTGTFDLGSGQFQVLWAATASFNLRNPVSLLVVGTGTGSGTMPESGILAPLPSGEYSGSLDSTDPAHMSLEVRNGAGASVLEDTVIVTNDKTVVVNVESSATSITGTLSDHPGLPSLLFVLPAALGGDTLQGSLVGSFAAVLPAACYANCDGSSVQPILTANDFQCYLNRFAAGESYANCDGSTTPPVLNANDFQCFLNKYAAGCG